MAPGGRGQYARFERADIPPISREKKWRAANPEKVAAYNERRRVGPVEVACAECGAVIVGRPNRVVCSRRCKDARYRRLHPVEWEAKRRRHNARLVERRKRERATGEPA